MDPCHVPSLLSLGWVLLTLGKQKETGEIIGRLDKLELEENTAKSREELRARLDELIYQTIECCLCNRSWKVPKDPPAVPLLRLFAMPPDNLPAGSCPSCGKTYCIGCAKSNLDPKGRFICTSCNQTLKLINDGLKGIIHKWAVEEGLLSINTPAPERPVKRRGRPKKSDSTLST
jgi:hypothetical protein